MLRYRALASYELEFDQTWNGFGLTSQAIQREAPKRQLSWFITTITMVYATYNYGIPGVMFTNL